MGAALVLLLVGLGALAAGVLIGRYYVPDDRQLRRTARHSRAYMRALAHLIARDHDTAIAELRGVVEENVEDVEPYFALGALFRSRGEHERAIRVHQALAVRERDRRKLRQRAMYELGLDFRAAGMPRRATKAMEEVLLEDPAHDGALRVLAALYEEQARYGDAAELWQRLGRKRGEDGGGRAHHLLVAAAQAALARADLDGARQLLKAAHKHRTSAHSLTAAAELAAARGDHAGARARLVQALIAEPALAPHLAPGLVAAAQAGAAAPGDAPAIAAQVLAALAEVEAATGPRLELALVRAQVAPAAAAATAHDLAAFPEALATRVLSARRALADAPAGPVRDALAALAGEQGALAWALHGRWQCAACGQRPGAFAWRCGGCRRWGTLRMETGAEPPPAPPRERRAAPRTAAVAAPRPAGLLGAAPDAALPAPTLDGGLSPAELAAAGPRRSLLGRAGALLGGWRRGR